MKSNIYKEVEKIYKSFPDFHFMVIDKDKTKVEAFKTWKETSEAIRANPGCAAFSLTPLDPRSYALGSHGEDAWKVFTRGKMPTYDRDKDVE